MPTISEPEPEQAAVEAAAVELVKLLETDHQEVVEQALEAVLGYSDAREGIALLRDLPPPTDAPQALLQLAARSVSRPKLRTDAAVALVNLSSDAEIADNLAQAGAAGTAGDTPMVNGKFFTLDGRPKRRNAFNRNRDPTRAAATAG